eukprot:5906883-Pleurochrysis_carterae.AAC.1
MRFRRPSRALVLRAIGSHLKAKRESLSPRVLSLREEAVPHFVRMLNVDGHVRSQRVSHNRRHLSHVGICGQVVDTQPRRSAERVRELQHVLHRHAVFGLRPVARQRPICPLEVARCRLHEIVRRDAAHLEVGAREHLLDGTSAARECRWLVKEALLIEHAPCTAHAAFEAPADRVAATVPAARAPCLHRPPTFSVGTNTRITPGRAVENRWEGRAIAHGARVGHRHGIPSSKDKHVTNQRAVLACVPQRDHAQPQRLDALYRTNDGFGHAVRVRPVHEAQRAVARERAREERVEGQACVRR